jgi:hypothetical protein
MSQREYKARWARESAADERKIGTLRRVASWKRRYKAEESVESWAATYLPNWFKLHLSEAHRDAASLLQSCTDDGGLACLAMSRGFGKTTWTRAAVMRAVLSGRRKYVVVICATDKLAEKTISVIKRELETNDRINADYPEVTQPVRALERITRRAFGQVWDDGTPTRIEWNAGGLTLPTAMRKGQTTPSSGGIVHAVGITGAVRGMTASGPDGEIIRPDMVVLDDVQTRESAKSPTQTSDRESVVCDDVLGLAGPTTAIAAAMLATPIYTDDLAERFLDSDRHPEWDGRRRPMLVKFPENMELWDQYRELRRKVKDKGKSATEFYVANRPAMDAGSEVTWPERMKPKELSGLQSAMNIWVDNPTGFKAEYQCEPVRVEVEAGSMVYDAGELAHRLSGLPRLVVPRETTMLTAFFDLGKHLHFYAVVAWREGFGGSVVDYGSWPRQVEAEYEAAATARSLAWKYPGHDKSQLVFVGLQEMTPEVLGRAYKTDAGGEIMVSRALIDSGYQDRAVHEFIRQSPYRNILTASMGRGRSATAASISEWKPRPGEKSGYHWRQTMAEKNHGSMIQFDTDTWKSILHGRLTIPQGGNTALRFFGDEPNAHALLGRHVAAEFGVPMVIRGIAFEKWGVRPDATDNHLLDCLVGCAVAASVSGLVLSATADGRPVAVERKKPQSFAALAKEKRAEKLRRQLAGVR